MIITKSDIPPFVPLDPSEAHHNERLLEYSTNLHEEMERRIAKGSPPEEVAEWLHYRIQKGVRVKAQLMKRMYKPKFKTVRPRYENNTTHLPPEFHTLRQSHVV